MNAPPFPRSCTSARARWWPSTRPIRQRLILGGLRVFARRFRTPAVRGIRHPQCFQPHRNRLMTSIRESVYASNQRLRDEELSPPPTSPAPAAQQDLDCLSNQQISNGLVDAAPSVPQPIAFLMRMTGLPYHHQLLKQTCRWLTAGGFRLGEQSNLRPIQQFEFFFPFLAVGTASPAVNRSLGSSLRQFQQQPLPIGAVWRIPSPW